MREHRPARYAIVGNHLTQHRGLSLVAIGLGAHIQSLPDGARVDIKTLAERFAEGRERIAGALRELEQQGYLVRTRERTPAGRIVSRTYWFEDPLASQTRLTSGPEVGPQEATGPEAVSREEPGGTPVDVAGPLPQADAPVAVARTREAEATPAEDRAPLAEDKAPPPERGQDDPAGPAARGRDLPGARQVSPSAPTPEESAPSAEEHRTASVVLTGLRRDDVRLLLSERDVERLVPAVASWLRRGVAPEGVRRVLTAGLPAQVRHPAALLAHRLAVLLPPPLPKAQVQGAQVRCPAGTGRPVPPLQNCDSCDRAFRAAEPGRCRDCREGTRRRSGVPAPFAAA